MDSNCKEIEICLCPKCASAFYDIPSYKIMKKDPYQVNKDLCTYCNSRFGYDFLISKRANVQKPRKHVIRTLESGAVNGKLYLSHLGKKGNEYLSHPTKPL